MFMNELKDNLYDYLTRLRAGEKSLPFRSEGGLQYFFVKLSSPDQGNDVAVEAYERGLRVLSYPCIRVKDLEFNLISEDGIKMKTTDKKDLTGYEWILKKSSEEMGFKVKLGDDRVTVSARNKEGKLVEWFYWDRDRETYVVLGNTDHLNIWLCDTTDLSADDLVKYFGRLQVAIKSFVDPEDWQEIGKVQDAYEDERYTKE